MSSDGSPTDLRETLNLNSVKVEKLEDDAIQNEDESSLSNNDSQSQEDKNLKQEKKSLQSNKKMQYLPLKDGANSNSHIENHNVEKNKNDELSDGTDEEYFEFFECEVCYLSFPSNKLLEKHEKEHSLGSSKKEKFAEKLPEKSDSDVPPPKATVKKVNNGPGASKGPAPSKGPGTGNGPSPANKNQNKGRGNKEKFRCEFCALKFTDQKLLIEHSKEHYVGKDNPPAPYRSTAHRKRKKPARIKLRDQLCCDICGLPCSSDEKLVDHLKAKHGDKSNNNKKKKQEKAFVCEICKASFSENHELGEHFREHFKERAENNTSKEKEKEKEASAENKCVCKTCGMGFPDFKALATHLKSHVARQTKPRKEPVGEAFICEICDAAFAKKQYLKKHMRIHLEGKPTCEICGVQCSNKSNLITHMMIHTGQKPYKCDICEVAYSKRCNLIKHQSIHTGEKPFKCHFCEAGFSNRSHMLAHVRLHTGETPYKCELCDQSFMTQVLLSKHQRQHTGERPFKCEICDAAFIQKSSLTYHMKRGIHDGEHPHKCWFCDLELTSQSRLEKHVKTHTEEKPFKCDSCLAEFSLKCTLNAHKKIHTGEKRFKCDKCDATFAKRGSLTLHQRVHTETQYQCNICDASYFQKGAFDMHMKLHSSNTFDDALDVYEKNILKSMGANNDSGTLNDNETHSQEVNDQVVSVKVEQDVESENTNINTGIEPVVDTGVNRESSERIYDCNICDATFSKKGALGIHMKLHSSNDFDDSLGEKDNFQSMKLGNQSGSTDKSIFNDYLNLIQNENNRAEIKVEPGIKSNEASNHNVIEIGLKRKYDFDENDFSDSLKRHKDFNQDKPSDEKSFSDRQLGLRIPLNIASSDKTDEIDGDFIDNTDKNKMEAAELLAEIGVQIVQGRIDRNQSERSEQRNTAKPFDYNTSLVEQINSYQDISITVNKTENDMVDQAMISTETKHLDQDNSMNIDSLQVVEMKDQAVDLSKSSSNITRRDMDNHSSAYNEHLQNQQLPYVNQAADMYDKAMMNSKMMGHASQPNMYANHMAYMEYMQRLNASQLSNNYQGASETPKDIKSESTQAEALKKV